MCAQLSPKTRYSLKGASLTRVTVKLRLKIIVSITRSIVRIYLQTIPNGIFYAAKSDNFVTKILHDYNFVRSLDNDFLQIFLNSYQKRIVVQLVLDRNSKQSFLIPIELNNKFVCLSLE